MTDDHLKVSTTTLADIGRSLGTLKDEFEHSSTIVDSFHGFIGSGELAGALGDFAGDWSKKREELCGLLDELGKVADTAARTYDGIDEHLAAALLKADK
jgi:VIT1/CCC1 family predicted Fe2+/Mn2+ transporter